MHAERDLPGAWQLRSWTLTDDRGESFPFGRDAHGLLLYTADGHMTANVSGRSRPALPGGKPRDASDEQLAAAFLSYFNYAGTWRIEDDTVIHEVSLALNPNTVGVPQRRLITFAALDAADGVVPGTVLVLSATEATRRGEREHRLTWERASSQL